MLVIFFMDRHLLYIYIYKSGGHRQSLHFAVSKPHLENSSVNAEVDARIMVVVSF